MMTETEWERRSLETGRSRNPEAGRMWGWFCVCGSSTGVSKLSGKCSAGRMPDL